MPNPSEINVLFLNVDLGREFTGIESSALIRGRIFEQSLGLPTQFLTLYYNPRSHDNFDRFARLGLASRAMTMHNMFDWIQGEDPGASAHSQPFTPPAGCVLAPVPDAGHDLRMFQSGECLAYLKHDEQGHLLFVNYLRGGRIWKRDWMSRNGRVSRSEFVDPAYDTADASLEIFWNVSGQPVLMRQYEFDDDKRRTMKSIQVLEQGRVSQQHADADDLIEAFVASRLDLSKLNVLILDRSIEYWHPMMRLRDRYPDHVKLVGIVHNTHFVHSTHHPGDPMTSEVSSFYKPMLSGRQSCDAMVLLTRAQCDDVRLRFGDGPFHVIGHAVPDASPPVPAHRDWLKVVVPGRFAEEKQHHLTIQAFKKVLQRVPNATLHFHGYGDKRRLMLDTIAELGLGQSVFLHDFDPDVGAIFGSAGLMMSSSRNEGFAITILQALHHGCPVVSFDCRYGPAEMIRDGVNGYLCPMQDVDQLAELATRILLDRTLQQNMSHQAGLSIAAFRESQVAEQWRNLLTALA